MRLPTTSLLSTLLPLLLSPLPTTTATSTIVFKNFCDESLYLTINALGTIPFPSGAAYTALIEGQGNTALLTKSGDAFSPEVAKAVLGSSTLDGVLYWSIAPQDGDPFGPANEAFNVTSGGKDATGVEVPNLCGNATGFDEQVHACQDSGEVVLGMFGCPFNAVV